MTETGQEKRQEKRRRLYSYLEVFDGVSSRLVGRVADLTRQGDLLLCSEPVPVREEVRLRIRFPRPIGGREEVTLPAVCRWCRRDSRPDTFVAGFQFQGLDRAETRFIACLIDDFGLTGG